MKQRILAWVLCLVMLFNNALPVFAEGDIHEHEESATLCETCEKNPCICEDTTEPATDAPVICAECGKVEAECICCDECGKAACECIFCEICEKLEAECTCPELCPDCGEAKHDGECKPAEPVCTNDPETCPIENCTCKQTTTPPTGEGETGSDEPKCICPEGNHDETNADCPLYVAPEFSCDHCEGNGEGGHANDCEELPNPQPKCEICEGQHVTNECDVVCEHCGAEKDHTSENCNAECGICGGKHSDEKCTKCPACNDAEGNHRYAYDCTACPACEGKEGESHRYTGDCAAVCAICGEAHDATNCKACPACEGVEGAEHKTGCENAPKITLYNQMMSATSLKDIFDIFNSDIDTVYDLTLEELITLEAYVNELQATTEDPDDYYSDVIEMITILRELLVDPSIYNHIGNFTADPPADTGGIETRKTSTPVIDDDGNITGYTISMDAWTTGEVIHGTTGNKVDIILVLDMSKQMQTGNRLAEMKEAAVGFIESSITTDGSRRIALVTYNNSASVLSGSGADNDAALVEITPESAVTMNQIINNLSNPAGASNIDYGLTKAAHIFQDGNSTVPDDRQRVVVLLSAGVFGSGNLMEVEGKDYSGRTTVRENNIGDLRIGQRGLNIANIIKTARDKVAPIEDNPAYFQGNVPKSDFITFFGSNFDGCGAEMYCVGIGMPKAELGGNYGDFKANYAGDVAFWKNYGTLGTMINEVMYRMSSHRPDSSHVGGSQYNSWEQDWKNLMKANGYSTWPAPHGFWEGHYWDNYTRNVSVNFPDLCDISYFIATDDASELSGIFNTINTNIGNVTVSLDTTTVLKDIVTPYFSMPEIPVGGTASSVIKVYTMDYNGSDFVESTKTDITNSVTVEMYPEENTVTVTGYNYDNNFITDEPRDGNFYGKKLIVEFTITPKEEFLGGNDVPTNAPGSGIYKKNEDGVYEILEEFDVPVADVKTDSNVEISSRVNAYLGAALLSEVTLDDLKGTIDVGYAGVVLKLDEPNYGLDPLMSKYISVDVKILALNSGTDEYEVVDRISNITEDTPYKLQVTVTPVDLEGNVTTGGCEPAEDTAEGEIKVFYPELTFCDNDTFYYGENIPNYDSGDATTNQTLGSCWLKDNTIWKNTDNQVPGTVLADGTVVTMSGEIPELDIRITTYDEGLTTIPGQDLPMNVNVYRIGYLEEESLNRYVTFNWVKCNPECKQNISEHKGTESSPEFYLHPQTCDLEIVKKGVDIIDENQSFIFQVNGPNNISMTVSIVGNGSAKIVHLPVGEYTVIELTDWSWRYTPASGECGTKLTASDSSGTVEFVNTRTEALWIDGNAWCKNVFGKDIETNVNPLGNYVLTTKENDEEADK